MLSFGKKLLKLYTRHSNESDRAPTYGRSSSPSDMLSSMSAAIPEDDTKWKLTNIGGIGSDEDKELREKAAESETEFEGVGQRPGLEIWRIEKFSPNRLEIRADNLSLYSGDCYIILKTIQKEDSETLEWNLHYWIGKDSTQDESGSAAYFTVNLDDMLEQKPVQHRELQFSESALFHSYFRSVTYLDGGIDSGFKKVEPESYKPRLLQMTALGSSVRVVQVSLAGASLNDGDVFILDNGLTVYQFNAPNSNVQERRRAMEIVNEDILAERDFEPELTILDGDEVFTCEPFWDCLGGKLDELPSSDERHVGGEIDASDEIDFTAPKGLGKISNQSGDLVLSLEKQGVESLAQDDVNEDDVWAVACDGHCFIYVGAATSREEKYYVRNRCDAILLVLGLDSYAPITFFSPDSDKAAWNQLFE